MEYDFIKYFLILIKLKIVCNLVYQFHRLDNKSIISPMNQNYYPVDFQAQYEQTSEKMIEITNKYKEKIKSMKSGTLQELDDQLADIQLQIGDNELQFRKQAIYSQFASGQLMAERRKQPPDMCPECGQELKKQVQCQMCAQVFCMKCCCRKRVIPFVSKDFRLCCEQCHFKFIKLFHNKQFYEEKEKLANVINFVKNKITKIDEKIKVKSNEVEESKKVKRDEKIKEKNMEGKIVQEEKKLKQLQEQFKKAIMEKAERIRQEQRRKQREEEERQKALKAEQERLRIEEEERLKLQREKRQAQQVQKRIQAITLKKMDGGANQESGKKDKLLKQAEERERLIMQSIRRKQQQLLRREQQLLQRQIEMKKQASKNSIDDKLSSRSHVSEVKQVTPKQSIGKNSSQKEQAIDTADSKSLVRLRRGSEDEELKIQKPPTKMIIQSSSRKETSKSNAQLTKNIVKQVQITKVTEQPTDSLQRSLANMFKSKKDDDTKSIQSNMSKASKSILDMSVNELLSVRIPVRTTSKAQIQPQNVEIPPEQQPQKPDFLDDIISPRKTAVDRRSIKVEQIQQQVNDDYMRMSKEEILRSSSLMTTQKQTIVQEAPANKCACIIM